MFCFFKTVIIFALTSESYSIACTFPCTSTQLYEIIKEWIHIMTANGLSFVKHTFTKEVVIVHLPWIFPETRRWVIRCLRSKLTLVFIWKNKRTLHVLLEPKECSFKIIYAIVYDRLEIFLCSLVQTKPDFSLVSIICKPSRKAKAESYITCEG